jgi:hypothetical protein
MNGAGEGENAKTVTARNRNVAEGEREERAVAWQAKLFSIR